MLSGGNAAKKGGEEELLFRKYCCFQIPASWHCAGVRIGPQGKDNCEKIRQISRK